MEEQKYKLVYNQIDFIIIAPKFRISFSYTDEKALSFVREYILRLLILCPCRPEEIAKYFAFTQYETENALNDLANKKWIEYLSDGNIGLTTAGRKLFKHNTLAPKLIDLRTKEINLYMELINENFIDKKHLSNNENAISLNISSEIFAFRSKYAERNFQQQFNELKDQGKLILYSDYGHLYKIDGVEVFNNKYFRFTQFFSLDKDTGNQLGRNDIHTLNHSEKIVHQVTNILEKYKHEYKNNVQDIISSMEKLNDIETLKIITPKFNFFMLEKINQKSPQDTYFVGQTYHQDDIQKLLKNSMDELKKNISQSPKILYWMGVENIYWGAQEKFSEQINLFYNNAFCNQNKKEYHLYNFRLYLPIKNSKYKNTKKNLLPSDKKQYKNNFYAFKGGFLNNNTEIIVFENQFAVVCYHAYLDSYDVPLPVGFITTRIEKVKHIFQLVQNYLKEPVVDKEESSPIKDFGKIFSNN